MKMSIRDAQREAVVDRLAAHLLETGLARTSLRQLAGAAGVSDRMLLYYFTDKAEVLAAVMARVAGDLATRLAHAIPGDERLAPAELVKHAATFTTGGEMRRFMRLWVEVVAAAAKGEEPFVAIAAEVMAGFRQWVDARLDLPARADREATAAAVIAVIDGLALVDICSEDGLASRLPGALGTLMAR